MNKGWRVELRKEHDGTDSRYLRAYLDASGNLHIDGHDLGPGTAPVSADGEYEWFKTIRAEDVPKVVTAPGRQRWRRRAQRAGGSLHRRGFVRAGEAAAGE